MHLLCWQLVSCSHADSMHMGRHDYNGLNPINGAAVDNSANAVHASTSKPAGAPQGRIKPAAVEKPAEKVGLHSPAAL